MSPLTAKSVLQRYEKCPKLKLRALYIDDAVGVKHGFEGNWHIPKTLAPLIRQFGLGRQRNA